MKKARSPARKRPRRRPQTNSNSDRELLSDPIATPTFRPTPPARSVHARSTARHDEPPLPALLDPPPSPPPPQSPPAPPIACSREGSPLKPLPQRGKRRRSSILPPITPDPRLCTPHQNTLRTPTPVAPRPPPRDSTAKKVTTPALVAATPTPTARRVEQDDYSPGLLSGQDAPILMSLSQSSAPDTDRQSVPVPSDHFATARRRRLSFGAPPDTDRQQRGSAKMDTARRRRLSFGAPPEHCDSAKLNPAKCRRLSFGVALSPRRNEDSDDGGGDGDDDCDVAEGHVCVERHDFQGGRQNDGGCEEPRQSQKKRTQKDVELDQMQGNANDVQSVHAVPEEVRTDDDNHIQCQRHGEERPDGQLQSSKLKSNPTQHSKAIGQQKAEGERPQQQQPEHAHPKQPKTNDRDKENGNESDSASNAPSSISSPPIAPESQQFDDSPEWEEEQLPEPKWKRAQRQRVKIRSNTPTPTKRRKFSVHSSSSSTTPKKQPNNSKKHDEEHADDSREIIYKRVIPFPGNVSDSDAEEVDEIQVVDKNNEANMERRNLVDYTLKTPPATSTLGHFVRQRGCNDMKTVMTQKLKELNNEMSGKKKKEKTGDNCGKEGSEQKHRREESKGRRESGNQWRRQRSTKRNEAETSRINADDALNGYESTSTNPPSPVQAVVNDRLDGEFRSQDRGRGVNTDGNEDVDDEVHDSDNEGGGMSVGLRYRAVRANIPAGGLLSSSGESSDDEVLVGESP